ncbi:protein kinase [Luteolibacter sp. SL250]|uniref:serine/threonine protein kinase n=1 Tax=Luteolibacter sp. SL250 TaxID=2995170 RepID=UPI00226FF95A|nr:protein kinase [Luteolibacter sp. SL250]WAC17868.1 protein kinase [Luteolibacter sp. SL250]
MKFLLHNEENITFPAIRPAYQEGELYFDRFRMLTPRDAKDSIIGEGGTGIIHLVRDELLDRIVALKLPHESILRDPSARFDVIRETRQAIELTHPNIVRIHDFHEGRRNWGISMQYVRGMNLDEWRHVGTTGTRRTIVTYDVERITAWISQLCDALVYAHEEAHMVHRDIKPKNLMLERWDDGHERLLLTDFGITQKLRMHTMMLSRVQSRTDGKGTMGTLPYMSMQQIQGESASIYDDIYAVGATIYELLTGRPPFYEGSYAQIRTQVETVIPPSMNQRLQDFDIPARDIPDLWEDAVSACLAKKPAGRPASIRELKSRLGLSDSASPATEDAHLRDEIIIISKALEERGQAVLALEAERDTLRRTIAETAPVDIPAGEWQTAYHDLKANFDATRFLLDAAMGERDAFHASLAETQQSHAELLQTHSLLEHEVDHLRGMFSSGEADGEVLRRAEETATARIQQAEEDARARIAAIEEEASVRIRQAEEAAGQRAAAAEGETVARIQQAEGNSQARIDAIQEESSAKIREAEEVARQRITAVEREAADRIQQMEISAQARIDAIQEEASAKVRQAMDSAEQVAAAAKSEAVPQIQQAESSAQARIDTIQEEASARIRQAEEAAEQRVVTAENEAAARIQQIESSVQARIDAIQEEASVKARQAEESGEQRSSAAEHQAAARIQQAEGSVQAKIDSIQEEASARIRQVEEAAEQRAGAAEREAAARIEQAELSVQSKIDVIQEEASARIRQAEESADQRAAAAANEATARARNAEDSVQARIDAIQEDAATRIREAEQSAEQRIASVEGESTARVQQADSAALAKITTIEEQTATRIREAEESAERRITEAGNEATSRISAKMEELEETGRVLRLKAARPLAEALAKLEAANQQLERLRAERSANQSGEG